MTRARDRRYYQREKQLKDSDDVFFNAAERKQEIEEQIKELQRGLHPRVQEKADGVGATKRRK